MSNQKSTNKHPQYKYASTREKYCFGIGAIGKDAICNLVGSFLMLYFTDTLYLAPAFVGVLFLVARIWDAINDPVMGMICDNTHTKFGKFRIWLVIGTLLNSVAFVLLFHSFHLSGTSLYIYVSVMYILYGMTYTIMDVPYWSWLPNLTNDPHEREKVSVIPRFFASLAGFSVATFGLYIINHLNKIAGEKNLYAETGYTLFAIIIAVIFIVAIGITVFNVKEESTIGVYAEKTSLKQAFLSLLKMISYLLLLEFYLHLTFVHRLQKVSPFIISSVYVEMNIYILFLDLPLLLKWPAWYVSLRFQQRLVVKKYMHMRVRFQLQDLFYLESQDSLHQKVQYLL